LLACRFGARRVYAIEPSDAIALARDIARANGYADRIEFIQGLSERTSLPEPVDVIVSDIRGVLPLHRNSVTAIVDARQRLLAPGGQLIPGKDRLMAAPVDAPNLYDKYVHPWQGAAYELDLSAARRFVTNSWHYGRATPEQLLAEPGCWGELDYMTLEEADVSGELSWAAARTGIVHGMSVWFESELAPGVTYSTAPDRPELVYGSAFFPLSEPVTVNEGDRIEVSLRADFVAEEYTWTWNTKINAAGRAATAAAEFRQSSFFSTPMLRAQLHKRAASYQPKLTEDGEIALLILQSMKNKRTLEAIAREVCERFPERFSSWTRALGHVGTFSGEYSEASTGSGNDGDSRESGACLRASDD
jgi:protein arginine N-methyltransferase 1